ncbi:M50 family metallopeptidase [uncultured Microbulbifer sp.]|uniref:M50 family metallopeptidase n=1 Tax=uncultured Microbulbifer sp. TaxID=348147 RepID=UPI00261FB91C|nr:M50 family metallopeptidase [uncultured Microbulbifer sp.]
MQSSPFISPVIRQTDTWPELRKDLQFHRVQEDAEQHTWMLFDPLRGQYLELGELEILVLQQWHLGCEEKIAEVIARDHGCELSPRQVAAVYRFAVDNELLQTDSETLSQKLSSVSPQQQRLHKLQRSIFWRRPLFTPDLSSRLLLPLARCTGTRGFYVLLTVTAVFCAASVGQHWTEFLAYFNASWNAVGALTFFCCYLLLSLFHELGHASVARLYQVRANSIGVGLIALMPIMFSEITDAWRLPRKARLHISAAGVLFEATLGMAAAVAWCLLDDGLLRALAFYLFTTSLVTTLFINANPLMKFDGYYLLSDYTREKNLQQSATNAFRSWSWSKLLRGQPAPIDRRQRLLALFGFASLLYRIVVFATISYAVYQLLFKAAGLALFLLCIVLLIAVPAYREVSAFFNHVKKQKALLQGNPKPSQQDTTMENNDPESATSGQPENAHTSSLNRIQQLKQTLQVLNPWVVGTLFTLVAILLTPLPWPVQFPASTYFANQQNVMAPAGAVLQTLSVTPGTAVSAGTVIAELHDNELDYRIARTRQELKLLNRRQHSDGFATELDVLDGVYLQDLLSKQQLLRALETEKQQLQIVASTSGTVDWVLPGLAPGQYLDVNMLFIAIADRSTLRGHAYGEPQQLRRLPSAEGQKSTLTGRLFVHGRWQPLPVTVNSVGQIASRRIQDPALSSEHGGPLQVLPDNPERSAEALHLLNFELQAASDAALGAQDLSIARSQRTGTLVLFGEPVSLMQLFVDRIAGVLIRESGV